MMKLETTKQEVKTLILVLILVLGLGGAVAAFVSTPKLLRLNDGVVYGCDEPSNTLCVEDTEGAFLRGAGVLVLAIAAFAGVTVIFRD